MTQIASLLVAATVFTWLIICNVYILQSWGGGGGLMRKGEHNRGILWYIGRKKKRKILIVAVHTLQFSSWTVLLISQEGKRSINLSCSEPADTMNALGVLIRSLAAG